MKLSILSAYRNVSECIFNIRIQCCVHLERVQITLIEAAILSQCSCRIYCLAKFLDIFPVKRIIPEFFLLTFQCDNLDNVE